MMQVHKHAAAKRQRKTPNKNGAVEVTKIDKRVMREALRLARGDAKRLKINKDGTVVVKN